MEFGYRATMTNTKRKSGWQQLIARFPQARLLWDISDKSVGELRAYTVNGYVVIVHEYVNDYGWTAYIMPDSFSMLSLEDTFTAIANHVGEE